MSSIDTATVSAFRPSIHTSAVLRQVLLLGPRLRGARVLDIGCGSGVLLAAAAELGAAELFGVDVEPDALDETGRLLGGLGLPARVETGLGHLYAPVGARRFDLVLANLPHFPMHAASVDGRLPTWSDGGRDGRRLLGPMIAGLGEHLAPGGSAIVAHNAFTDLDETRAVLAAQGLTMEIADRLLIPVAAEKLIWMTPEILDRELGRTIHRIGDHVFTEVAVLRIAAPDAAGAAA
ncbi:methyltransferase domain-containing protein [Pseudodonghicola flavimaris]|uniref:50S ribosomal protein L11 methyltransferase n=1 Tax=Pseudodonghicola flavimaris TaxID=3050036 RepID=A0ABT7F0R5_9RHOB|nr:50S ribosomal protein L11 methyltransferase [Pseudodonghicola flavimaris]MDK3018206.1 50S ribosomal protein L11 methyltransferase [Pseudodonghicola flavimaris]